MLTKLYTDSNAVVEGERFGLNLINENPHLAHWLPLAYYLSNFEFENPQGVLFEYDGTLGIVTKHTYFSNFISDLKHHSNHLNMPVRSIVNGIGSTNAAAILFAIYAIFVYLRLGT